MVATRRCASTPEDGRACGAPPLKGGDRCVWHAPDRSDEAAEARKLGGLRRRRERTIAGAYDLSGLDSVAAVRRSLEIAVLDTMGLETSVARSRVLVGAVGIASRLLDAEREAAMAWEVE